MVVLHWPKLFEGRVSPRGGPAVSGNGHGYGYGNGHGYGDGNGGGGGGK